MIARLVILASCVALAACESNAVRSDPDSWSKATPANAPATTPETKSAPMPAPDPTPPAVVAAAAPVEAPAVVATPIGPMPPPTLRAQLRDLEAVVEGSDLVLRAELIGEAAGEGEVIADRVTLVVELHGPGGGALESHGGGPLGVRLAPIGSQPIQAGAVRLHLEGRLAIADLDLRGAGLHQLVPEMAGELVAGITLEPIEQFPYVWITQAETAGGGRNDARVLSALER